MTGEVPGVRAAPEVCLESPATAVVRAAEGATLLVAGRREHRTGLAFGRSDRWLVPR
ncbi:hypothetical protein [Streptomyces siamensis]|uniref:hypothetical protein n=1 Tax=Streptomyces siamensis TaxID=1274986 RepID=UPI0031EE3CC4